MTDESKKRALLIKKTNSMHLKCKVECHFFFEQFNRFSLVLLLLLLFWLSIFFAQIEMQSFCFEMVYK